MVEMGYLLQAPGGRFEGRKVVVFRGLNVRFTRASFPATFSSLTTGEVSGWLIYPPPVDY